MGGGDSKENQDSIRKLREFQQQNNSNQQLQSMYTNQNLNSNHGTQVRRNPWEVANTMNKQVDMQQATKVQGIQNDFIFDKTTLKWERTANPEVLNLVFNFQVKAPWTTITFYQKVEEIAEVDPTTNQACVISFGQ